MCAHERRPPTAGRRRATVDPPPRHMTGNDEIGGDQAAPAGSPAGAGSTRSRPNGGWRRPRNGRLGKRRSVGVDLHHRDRVRRGTGHRELGGQPTRWSSIAITAQLRPPRPTARWSAPSPGADVDRRDHPDAIEPTRRPRAAELRGQRAGRHPPSGGSIGSCHGGPAPCDPVNTSCLSHTAPPRVPQTYAPPPAPASRFGVTSLAHAHEKRRQNPGWGGSGREDRPTCICSTTRCGTRSRDRRPRWRKRSDRARRFDPAVSVFAGVPDDPTARELGRAARARRSRRRPRSSCATSCPSRPGWTERFRTPGTQMVCDRPIDRPTRRCSTSSPLTTADVPEMLELVERTRPGPLLPRTIELGTYLGPPGRGRARRDGGHPDAPPRLHRDQRGLHRRRAPRSRAGQQFLVGRMVNEILGRGEIACLHAVTTNTAADPALRDARASPPAREMDFALLHPPVGLTVPRRA